MLQGYTKLLSQVSAFSKKASILVGRNKSSVPKPKHPFTFLNLPLFRHHRVRPLLHQIRRAFSTEWQRILIVGGILVLELMAVIILGNRLAPREIGFKRQYFGKWDYTATIHQANMEAAIAQSRKGVRVQVTREKSGIEFELPLNKPVLSGSLDTITVGSSQGQEVTYQVIPNGLKETITLANEPLNNTFISSLKTSNLIPQKTPSNIIAFYDSQGKYQFHLEKPFAVDATGNQTFAVKYILKTIEKEQKNADENTDLLYPRIENYSGHNLLLPQASLRDLPANQEYQLTVEVDPEWLYSPERQYPLIIDPTVVHDTTSEFATGQLNRAKDIGSGSNPSIETYYQELTIDEHTVGLWHMNETTENTCSGGTNDICDSSGNANNGAFTSGASFTTSSRLGASATAFDGSNDYVSIANSTSLSSMKALTMEAWINIAGTSGGSDWNAILMKGTFGNNGYGFLFQDSAMGSGAGVLRMYIPGIGTLDATPNFQTNTWYHIAGTADANERKIYIDGKLVASSTGGTISVGTQPLYIGTDNATGYPIQGTIDEVRISNVVRSAEEIKAAAQRRPYSVHTSDVLDLAFVQSWTNLTWDERGVQTSDGETASSSANLVAQWNLNSSSGTTATNDAGTCGTTCNGTLTSFASTSSQDAAIHSGWTADRRWGAGAVMFDGTNDHIVVTNTAALQQTSNITLEAWIKTNSGSATYRGILSKMGAGGSTYGYSLRLDSSGKPEFGVSGTGSNFITVTGGNKVSDGQWHHLVGVYTPSTSLQLYVDGKLVNTTTASVPASIYNNTANLTIGATYPTPSELFSGTIDTPRLYSRSLPTHEILSNYQTGNIELQTRVGSDSTPDDGSWEEWRTASNEAVIETFDGPHQYNTSDTNLKGYWPMDETANNSCTGGTNDVCDKKTGSSLDLADSGGSLIGQGKFGKARIFDGTNDYLSCTDANCGGTTSLDLPTTPTFSIAAWFKTSNTGAQQAIVGKRAGLGAAANGYSIHVHSDNMVQCRLSDGTNQAIATGTRTVTDGMWHSVVCTSNGTTLSLYLDGALHVTASVTSVTGTIDNATDFVIGQNNSGNYYKGSIDEVRFVNGTAMSTGEVSTYHHTGSRNPNTLNPSLDTTIKLENTGSYKIEAGRPQVDQSTIGLWHFDETSGSGAYIKDSSSNANNGTPTGTSTSRGISQQARSFNGTSDYIDMGDIAAVDTATTLSGCSWVYHNSTSTDDYLIAKNNGLADGFLFFRDDVGSVTGRTDMYKIAILDSADTDTAQLEGATGSSPTNKWTHVCFTFQASSATGLRLYINGVEDANSPVSTSTIAALDAGTNPLRVGADSGGANFLDGKIDEVVLFNKVLSYEEIMEQYRSGANYKINIPISSTDLSAKKKLPFYVAADRPGTYLEAVTGESAYSNYLQDNNTVAFWHLDELSGSGAYIKDSSGNGRSGTPTGTTPVDSKIGKGRYFNGSSYITASSPATYNTSRTVDFWFKPTSTGTQRGILSVGNSTVDGTPMFLIVQTSGNLLSVYHGSNYRNGVTTLVAGQWYHGAYTFNASNNDTRLYLNGVLEFSGTVADSNLNNTNLYIGTGYNAGWLGDIDEVRVSNTVRTAEEIRQAHEVGRRSHPITIDFASSLAHSNHISDSSDLSFTLTATPSGTTNPGDNIFKGDKIIVRENYNGTEYIAQGTVTAVTVSTGAVTVAAWDSGSTFPSVGYSPNASVFKWQREYWDITGPMDSHLDATANITLRLTNGGEGRTFWVDDMKSNSDYLTTPTGSSITSSTANQYFQYRVINSSSDAAVSPQLRSATLDYVTNERPSIATFSANFLHNKIKLNDTTPEVRFTGTDTNGDSLVYQVSWDTDSDFASATTKTSDTDAGFANVPIPGDTSPFNSGQMVSYTWQTALTNNTTYFYRVRSKDPAGTNTYSDWSEIRSFTIDTSITNPFKWFETDADQFTSDTIGGVTIDHTNNQVTLTEDSQLNSADTVANWTTSDGTYFPVAQETTIKQEGTGSVKVTLNSFTGDGTDSAITISNSKNILTDIIAGNRSTYADGIVYRVTTPADNTTSLTRYSGSDTLSNGLAAGDHILLINMEGVSGDVADVGNYEIASISAITSTTITLASATTKSYNGTTASNQKVYAQRIPQYTDVTIQSGGTLTATAYNGAASAPYYTGIVTFKAQGTVNVQSGGSINVDAKGYSGGGTQGTGNGYAGYSYSGAGAANWPRNLGGGGGGLVGGTTCAGGGGGGGGYGAVGTNGVASQTNGGGEGGTTYGAAALTTFFVGSGGGGGGNDTNGPAGSGGVGGGAVLMFVDVATVSGTISANGANGGNASNTAGGGGGGSGGSIMINAYNSINGSSLVTATAGSGGTAGGTCPSGGFGVGGAGAVGRIRIEADSISGTSSPTASTTTSPASSQNDTVTWTTSQDLSSTNQITFWVRGTRDGQYMRFEFGETNSNEQTYDITINSANTWEQKTWDISGISTSSRDAVTKFAFRATDSSPSPETFYFDDIHLNSDTGSIQSTTITAADIYSVSSKWFSLAFTDNETSGDIKYQIYYDVGGTPTIVPDSVLPSNSTGFDTSPVDLRGLSTTTYPILYVKANLARSGGSPILYDWTVNLTQPPEIPSLDSPADGTVALSTNTPTLLTTTSDQDSDYMRYKIEICTDLAMTTACQTYDQTSSQTGWSGQNTQTSTAYTSGTQGSYTVQTPLSWGTTYYWRTYAIDPADTNTWGYTQATPYSFRTNYQPSVPTLDEPLNGAVNVSLKPALKTTSVDLDDDYLRYKIELCTDLAMTTNCQTFDQTSSQTGWWGQNVQGNTAYSSGRQGIYNVQTPLSDFVTYYWRSYAIDPAGTNAWTGTQSPAHSFTTVFLQPTECVLNEGTTDTSVVLSWIDNSTAENQYRVERSVNGGAWSLLSTEAANATTKTDSTISQGNQYRYRVRAETTGGADYSTWCTTATVNLNSGSMTFEKIMLEGLGLD